MASSIGPGPDHPRDEELAGLRRRVVADGYSSAHSCQHCDELTISVCDLVSHKYVPEPIAVASEEEMRQRIADGCRLWLLVSDEVDYEILKHKRDGLTRVRFGNQTSEGRALSYNEDEELESLSRRCLSRRTKDAFPLTEPRVGYVEIWLWYSEFVDPYAHLTIHAYQDGIKYTIHLDFTVFSLPGGQQISNNRHTVIRPPNADPGSAQSLQLIHVWIQKCALEHGCGIHDHYPSSMPAMLLNVARADEYDSVRIVMPGEKHQYLALSYCWGPIAQRKMLTKSTRSEFMKDGIRLEELDATIQDAVRVTRELGYLYLWIDALCIVQDDDDFRARELSRMDDIYENASITIVAARSRSVSEGFLTQRQLAGASSPDKVFKVTYKRPDEQQSVVENWVVLVPGEREEDWKTPNEPWASRAWTLQEELLSRRQLRFGTRQTSWVCYCSQKPYEDFDGWFWADLEHARMRNVNGRQAGRLIKQFGSLSRILQQPDLVESVDEAREDWYNLVGTYSRRTLSFEDDRLPAISAVSRRMAQILGVEDEYWCGIWKSNAPWELLWRPSLNAANTPEGSNQRRVQPSWTWASRNGGVGFQKDSPNESKTDLYFDVVEHVAEYRSPEHKYGAVAAAQLRVKGLITTAPFGPQDIHNRWGLWSIKCRSKQGDPSQFEEDGSVKLRRIFRTEGRLLLERLPHELLANPDWGGRNKQIVLLLVGYRRSSYPGLLEPRGLVLWNEGGNQFSRLGMFYFEGPRPNESDYFGGNFRTEDGCIQTFHEFWGGKENVQEIVLV